MFEIAAIDNTTRKFMSEGKRPLTVGFWFSLGHSSVVFLAALIIAGGFSAFAKQVCGAPSACEFIPPCTMLIAPYFAAPMCDPSILTGLQCVLLMLYY